MSRALAALVTVGLLAVGCGESDSQKNKGSVPGSSAVTLRWETPPTITTPDTLPNDRVLAGVVKNDSSVAFAVDRDAVKLVDRSGRPVFAATRFSNGFGRDIYPPRYGRNLPEADRLRLGLRTKVPPGGSTPVTIAWRVKDPSRAPVRVEFGAEKLDISPG